MPNPTLEKNQKEAYNSVIAKYTFSCKGAGVSCEEHPELEVLKPGIRLHFLRYGLFDRNSDDTTEQDVNAPTYTDTSIQKAVIVKEDMPQNVTISESIPKKKENDTPQITLRELEILNLENAPTLKNFYVARTALNAGYVYLINDEDQHDFYELEINAFGQFRHILWEFNKDENGEYLDQRTSSETYKSFKLVKPGKKLWVAYSPVQWSRAYHNTLNTNAEMRKKRMTLIDCSGIQKEAPNAQKHCMHFANVHAVFPNEHPAAYTLQHTLEHIHANEKNQDETGDNEVFEDMFVTFHDPIGYAEDVGSVLIDKHQKHEALIESIQTGENHDAIFDRLQRNETRSDTPTDYEKQVAGLFSTALTTYQLIYNDSKMEEEYAETTDKNKVLKILAVEERKNARKLIESYRNDFGKIVSSTYYDEILDAFCDVGNQSLFESNVLVAHHIALLARHPHYVDRHLDLKNDYTGKQDNWASFLEGILCGKTNIHKILEAEIKLEDLKENQLDAAKGFGLSKKFIGTVKSITDGYAKYATSEANFKVVLKYVKSFTYKGEVVIQLKRKELESAIRKGFLLNIRKWVEEDALVNYKKGHKLLRLKAGIQEASAEKIVANKTLSVPATGQGNTASGWIKKVMEHPRFRATIAALEVINTAIKINKVSKSGSLKDATNTTGAMLSLISASTSYAEAKMLAKGHIKDVGIMRPIGNFAKITGFLGSGIGVGMCVWDSIETYQSRDYDASIAWGITGALSAVLLADSIVAFVTGATFGFLAAWPLAIIFVLVLVGVALAIYFTDTPLEKFLKNSILNSEHKLNGGTKAPYVYIEEIYNKRSSIVESDFKEWRDLQKASQMLYDLLISYRNTTEVLRYHYQEEKHKSWGDHIKDAIQLSAGVKYKQIQEVKIKVHLRKFLYNTSEFDFAMKLFIDGVQTPNTKDLQLMTYKTNITTDDNGADVLELIYKLNANQIKQINLGSEFVFISRTIINRKLNEYWPSQQGGDRYMGYKFGATDWLAPTLETAVAKSANAILDEVWGSNIRIGTSNEIYNAKTWNA